MPFFVQCWLISALFIYTMNVLCTCIIKIFLWYENKNVFFKYRPFKLLVLCSLGHSNFFWYELNDEVFGTIFCRTNLLYNFVYITCRKVFNWFNLSNLFCVGQYIHNQYVILCIKKIYSHSIFSDWLYLFLYLLIISSHCRNV